jgi:hypothetical protein
VNEVQVYSINLHRQMYGLTWANSACAPRHRAGGIRARQPGRVAPAHVAPAGGHRSRFRGVCGRARRGPLTCLRAGQRHSGPLSRVLYASEDAACVKYPETTQGR